MIVLIKIIENRIYLTLYQKNMQKAIYSNPIFVFAVHFELLHIIVFDKWKRFVQSNSYKNRELLYVVN
jgi:hypothetical protein